MKMNFDYKKSILDQITHLLKFKSVLFLSINHWF